MLLRLTINTRRKSPGYYADEIEAPNAYDRLTKKYRGEYANKTVKKWLKNSGVKTLFVAPSSLWENGYVESFNSKLATPRLQNLQCCSVFFLFLDTTYFLG